MDIDVEPYLNLSSGMEFSNWKPEGWRVWEAGADLHCLGEDDLEQPHLGRVPLQAQDWEDRGRPGEHQVCRDYHGPHLSDLWLVMSSSRNKKISNVHLPSHEDVKPFVCDICPKTFKLSNQLRLHKDFNHSQDKTLASQIAFSLPSAEDFMDDSVVAWRGSRRCVI